MGKNRASVEVINGVQVIRYNGNNSTGGRSTGLETQRSIWNWPSTRSRPQIGRAAKARWTKAQEEWLSARKTTNTMGGSDQYGRADPGD